MASWRSRCGRGWRRWGHKNPVFDTIRRMDDTKHAEIDDLLREDRTFTAPASFKTHALVRDESIYADAERDPEAFWARFAEELEWSRRWDRVLDWQPPHAKWFIGGTLNASVNCLDRH